MAHSLSAKKRIRQNEKRNARNRAERATIKSQLRKADDALHGPSAAVAEKELRAAIRLLDRSSAKGLIHKNEAARRKSRLSQRLNGMKAKQG